MLLTIEPEMLPRLVFPLTDLLSLVVKGKYNCLFTQGWKNHIVMRFCKSMQEGTGKKSASYLIKCVIIAQEVLNKRCCKVI